MARGFVPAPPDLVASCPVWTRRRFFQAMLAAGLGAFIPAIGGGPLPPSRGGARAAPPTALPPPRAPPAARQHHAVPRAGACPTPPSSLRSRTRDWAVP